MTRCVFRFQSLATVSILMYSNGAGSFSWRNNHWSSWKCNSQIWPNRKPSWLVSKRGGCPMFVQKRTTKNDWTVVRGSNFETCLNRTQMTCCNLSWFRISICRILNIGLWCHVSQPLGGVFVGKKESIGSSKLYGTYGLCNNNNDNDNDNYKSL